MAPRLKPDVTKREVWEELPVTLVPIQLWPRSQVKPVLWPSLLVGFKEFFPEVPRVGSGLPKDIYIYTYISYICLGKMTNIFYIDRYIYIYQYIQTCSFKDQAGKTLAAHCLGISGYHGDPDIYLRPRKAYIYIHMHICIYIYIWASCFLKWRLVYNKQIKVRVVSTRSTASRWGFVNGPRFNIAIDLILLSKMVGFGQNLP